MKAITTYKEHKEKPNEQVQGLGRALAYGGLDYIFNLLKNDEYYSEELEDGIVGIEAYINEREHEIERLTNDIKELLKENSNKEKVIKIQDNIINRTTKYVESLSSSGRGCDIYDDIKQEILKELKGVDKECK